MYQPDVSILTGSWASAAAGCNARRLTTSACRSDLALFRSLLVVFIIASPRSHDRATTGVAQRLLDDEGIARQQVAADRHLMSLEGTEIDLAAVGMPWMDVISVGMRRRSR
jgi:hypothetical protein